MSDNRRNPRSILITGASGGIGAALAECYAAPGLTLFLSGRDAARLDAVTARCESAGARVVARTVDVADRTAMAAWVAACDGQAPLDLVIANAGISGGTGPTGDEDEKTVRDIFAVNLAGVLNTVLPAISPMTGRGRGQIAIVSSLAGYRGLPSAPAYSASKAAVKAWGEGLRPRLARHGVNVSVVCPGFVESRITDANDFPMPLLMPADKAARIIRRGLERNRARIAFPRRLAAVMWLIAALPAGPADAFLRRLPNKR